MKLTLDDLQLTTEASTGSRACIDEVPQSFTVNRESSVAFSDIAAIPINQSASSLTKGLVQEDEIIILLIRPSLWYVALSSMWGLLFIALVTFALAYMAKFMSQLPGIGWSDRQAFALGIGLAALRTGWQFLEWLSRIYILTDRRVITRYGVWRLIVFETQLKNVQHTSVFASMSQRLFGLGTLGFATAGSDTFESFWVMIKQPFIVHKAVVEAIRRYGR